MKIDFVQIGDNVEWDSQAQGSWKRKRGVVTEVQEKNCIVSVYETANSPTKKGERVVFNPVNRKSYRPLTSQLKKVKQ